MRTIAGKRIKDKVPISTLRNLTGIRSLNRMANETILIEAWKAVKYKIPIVSDCFTEEKKAHSMTTRRAAGQVVKASDLNEEVSFVSKAIKLWNMAPKDVRMEEDCKCAKAL